ncbi:MAG: tyrosine-protein phosphatase [Candidatus Melainabacteria bacterium]|nr:tyrosine-protein phosphatase [Candidatus Melainabacteria bacterium]
MRVTPSSLQKRNCVALAIALSACAPQMVQAADAEAVSAVETPVQAPAVQTDTVVHVRNFERVSANLMRGGAPSARAMKELKAAGVKTIVNLRGGGAASKKEERAAMAIGLDYYNIPMGYADPNLTKVSSVLDIIRDPARQPVYIHCLQGADRTGMIVGIHRVLSDGWQFDRAYTEMRGHHFKPFLIPMRKTVQAFASGKYTYVERQGISIAGVSAKPNSTKLATEKSL